MAPTKNKVAKSGSALTKLVNSLTFDNIKGLLFDPHRLTATCITIFVFEIFLNILIIERVNYTEIDWGAYMQEVEGVLNGTLDYQHLKGDTGPLVYPAGFIYIYSLFYYITGQGQNIHLAQYIFLAVYLVQIWLSFRIFIKTAKIPPYALILTTLTSYRIHSIYVLRLFNDPIAVLLFYVSLNCFIDNRWVLGSIFYSLAVSVKMNILLYAPCLLIAYLTNLTLLEAAFNLLLCGIVQLVLGAPFLLANPYSYIKGSFDLGRIFEHKWTVNYRFLSRELFENRTFHLALLALHLLVLMVFVPHLKRYLSSYAKLSVVTEQVKVQLREERRKKRDADAKLSRKEREFLESFVKEWGAKSVEDEELKLEKRMAKVGQLLVLPFFVTNFIGIVFARSLHYQFYCWYFYSLVYLVFSTGFSKPFMFLLLAAVEYCWNVYPSTEFSSALLHLLHFILLFGVYKMMKK